MTALSLIRRAAGIAALLVAATACKHVPIDPNDSTNPTVTFYLKGTDGLYHEASSTEYGNSTASQPIELKAVVRDPEGVKSNDLRVSDNTVDTAYCGGGLYPGNWVVSGLPGPEVRTVSGSNGKAPTTLTAFLTIDGILPLADKPPGQTQACFPANNTSVTVRCIGKNWASNAAASTDTGYFQVTFKF